MTIGEWGRQSRIVSHATSCLHRAGVELYRLVYVYDPITLEKFCTAIDIAKDRRSPDFIAKHLNILHIADADQGRQLMDRKMIIKILETARSAYYVTIISNPFEELDTFFENSDLKKDAITCPNLVKARRSRQ